LEGASLGKKRSSYFTLPTTVSNVGSICYAVFQTE
jgi:hypothetical protein